MTGLDCATPDVVVSVIVLTYNHESFIANALDSVLAQRADFPVEILISEDDSTDGTRDIVREYAAKNATRVRLLLSDRNLNSNEVTARAIEAARGRYLAIMDGDDYWTSPEKLQCQVSFLEAHPDCSVCFHDMTVVDTAGHLLESTFVRKDVARLTDLDDILVGNYVPGSAAMIRRLSLSPLPLWLNEAPYCDWALLVLAARQGRLGFLAEVLGAYRRHAGGVWSGLDEVQRLAGIVGFLNVLAERIWPDRQGFVRRVRAGWRVNLLNTLERRGEHAAAAREIEEGVRCGDVSRTRTPDRDPTSLRADDDARSELAVRIGSRDAAGGVSPSSNDRPNGYVDSARFSMGGRQLTVSGWGAFREDDPRPTLVVESSETIADAAVVRLQRTDVAKIVDPMLERSGFWLRMVADDVLRSPVRLVAVDQRGVQHPIGEVMPPA